MYDVGWTAEAAADELVGPVATERRGVQWNSDVVTALPEGTVVLAETARGELQAARFAPTAWGVQLHPEVDRTVLESWAAGDRDDHLEKGIDQEAVLREIDGARAELDEAWRPLAVRFAELARRSR
jgi:GMP synthase (glutamine-hydrolysing)